ncbi:hypothetical protein C9F11_09615 [Streptomyces sp. YIM 121038]|uniref:hypothetical protein n=1 Tax=Streptomyces sp. YIM 121038 TaxID=2136401 RepID=UPI001110DE81|nr:hypothetical protein [Streptomyces sp. YIM 121038]QCX75611.1 hypothetical protein C9F11_09615 [Streptomyces sp. YIM 121038]
MKRSGPLFTLLGGLLLALFMLTLNATTGSGSSSYGDSSSGAAKPAAPPAASASPSAKPSPSKKPSPAKKPRPPADGKYTGRTDDDTASVAITLRGGRATAYFCDGRTTESWLKGDVEDDGSLRLTGEGGAKLDGRVKGDTVRGTVDVRGGPRPFTAPRTEKKPAGLYRARAEVRGERLDGGWIVQPDGSQVGLLSRDGKPAAAPRLDPGTGAVRLPGGGRLTARPVVP